MVQCIVQTRKIGLSEQTVVKLCCAKITMMPRADTLQACYSFAVMGEIFYHVVFAT